MSIILTDPLAHIPLRISTNKTRTKAGNFNASALGTLRNFNLIVFFRNLRKKENDKHEPALGNTN